MRFQRRLANYHEFRRRLPLPLVTVELSFQDDFDLGPADGEIVISLRGRDVMWQKERLLNRALAAVPAACRKVAWLDGDLIFGRDDWPQQACRALEDVPVVQLFGEAYYLPPEWKGNQPARGDAYFSRPAIARSVASGRPIYKKEEAFGFNQRGHAWAARRELLQSHRFYDACILGSGDAVMALAAWGEFDHAAWHIRMNERQRQHYLTWAEPYHAAVRGKASFVEGDLFHLWHGSEENRRLGGRYQGLEPFEFDPRVDIAADGEGGWRWNSDKPAMHRYVRDYFAARKEDG
jgi:hypothetical protein